MNISALFIKRPVMTTLVMLAIMLFGILAYRLLPVNDLPNVDFPTILVNASLPGASPETMSSAVATPLERQFSTIAGVSSMTSSNSQGSTQITLQFDLNRDLDAAAQDVQSAISQASRQLPSDMPSPPSYRKVNPADQPILYIVLSSPLLPLSTVNRYAEEYLAQRISMVSGVAQVQVFGSQKYAVRIQVDPRALATRGIGIDEVVSAIRQSNVNLPTGTLNGRWQNFTVQASGQLTDAHQYEPLIVAWRNGAPVRLSEIGKPFDSVENDKIASWFNNNRAISLAIQRQPGTNTIEVVDAVKGLMATFRQQLPASIRLEIMYDRSETIRASVHEVKMTLLLTMCLVISVIFIFLRSLRATLIPSLVLPLSVVGTFGVIYSLGFSLNNLSIVALILAVGFVVDDAIVMLENIVRHVEHGEQPRAAALAGGREIGFTILSMTLSLVAVFIPVLFMGGIIGRLLHEFAITIAVAILISGVVSLTLTPMMCSRFLRPPGQEHHGALFRAAESVFTGMLAFYRMTLDLTLRFRPVVMIIFFLTLLGTVKLFQVVPKGFLPSEDLGRISIQTEAAQGISYAAMTEHQQAAANVVAQDKDNIAGFSSSVGPSGQGGTYNTGRMFLNLKPRDERPLSADEIIQALRPKMAKIPGLRVFMQNPPSINFSGRMTRGQYQYTLQSPDSAELFRWAPILESKLRQLPGLQDISSDLQITNPQVNVHIDRDKASSLGVSAEQIETALFSSYGSRQVSTIYAPTNEYQVILELAPEYQRDPLSLRLLYVRTNTGQLVPLETIARFDSNVGPLTVNHQGQLPAVTLSFNLVPGTALGTAVDSVEAAARQTLPATIISSFQGTAQAFNDSLKGLSMLLIMAIVVIYIVLGILYESFIHPITILSGLPAAGVGALLALKFMNMDLDMYSFVGVIMLVGIVKKNAIMMIDFALDAQRQQGLFPAEAIRQGCLIRFRPIMMTTVAALMGVLPIALGTGAGSEARRPLGIAVVGGLLLSQLLTLYITPVFYTYMEKFRQTFSRKEEAEAEAVPEQAS